MTQPTVFIAGPTASGKSLLAMELCQRFPCEIISVDSATVYRGLDVGTAKPDVALRSKVPHHLVDIRDPVDRYSAGQFCKDALAALARIRGAGKIPVLVGGTGLYFRALERGLSPLPEGDHATRQNLQEAAERCGWPELHRSLAEADPETAAKIHPNDAQRISRALEVLQQSGLGQRGWHELHPPQPVVTPSVRVLVAPQQRARLHQRIEARFDDMLRQDIVGELVGLRAKWNLDRSLPSMRLVGYRQVWSYLEGELDHDGMRSAAVAATRQLARRQLTWFRSWQGAEWLDPEGEDAVGRLCSLVAPVAK